MWVLKLSESQPVTQHMLVLPEECLCVENCFRMLSTSRQHACGNGVALGVKVSTLENHRGQMNRIASDNGDVERMESKSVY